MPHPAVVVIDNLTHVTQLLALHRPRPARPSFHCRRSVQTVVISVPDCLSAVLLTTTTVLAKSLTAAAAAAVEVETRIRV